MKSLARLHHHKTSSRVVFAFGLSLSVAFLIYLNHASAAGGNPGPAVNPASSVSTLYTDASVELNGNINLNPLARFYYPASSFQISTDSSFKGSLSGDPITGVLSVTNAHPIGTYTVHVRVDFCGGACGTIIDTFQLTVLPLTAGNYPNVTVGLSGNSIITPDPGPNFATSVKVSTNTDFQGILVIDPATSVVRVTNAHPVGTYPVTVTAFDSAGASATKTFQLTVPAGTPCLSAPSFTSAPNVAAGPAYSVAIGDFNHDGKQDLAIADYNFFVDPFGTPNHTVSIRLGDGAGNFTGSTELNVGRNPDSVAIGDFNKDGNQDLAIGNQNDGTISIRLGDGTGNFSSKPDVSLGVYIYSLVIGDFNNDGKLDLATANAISDNSGNVSIRFGDGAGNFTGSTTVNVGGAAASVAIGDFNNDGKLDFATANYSSNNVSVRFGDGTGNFTGSEVSVGSYPYSIVIGDFNHDGKPDFATANYDSNNVSIRLGDGAGNFTGSEVSVGSHPTSLAIGDFNHDGKQDLAIANLASGTVSLRLGDGAGNFTASTEVGVGASPFSLAVGDFNSDGGQDFVIANTGNSVPSVRLAGACSNPLTLGNYPNTVVSLGSEATITPGAAPANASSINISTSSNFRGTFAADPATGAMRVTNASPAGVYAVTVTAFGGGASTSKTFQLTVQQGTACAGARSFTSTGDVGVGLAPYGFAIGDFNNDGKQDLASGNSNSNTVSIRLGDAAGNFTGSTEVSVGSNPLSVAVGDFNGDGKQDFAAANAAYSGTVSIRLGDGAGNFAGSTEVSVGSNPISVAIADFNGDGKPDLAVANKSSNNVSIRLGDGAGNFTGTTDLNVGSSPYSVVVGDFNNDGKPDFATANFDSGTVSVRLGDGAGNFTGSTEVGVGIWPTSVAIGDFNNDGNQDFATANTFSGTVSISIGDGAGNFTGSTEISVGAGPYSVAIGDFNNDGKQDFAVSSRNSNTVVIRYGDGAGNFSGITRMSVGSDPVFVALGDFNNDGQQDFATANRSSDNVTIRLGEACGLPPAITSTSGISRAQGSPATNSQIATVTDDGGAGNVIVTIISANPSNGVTISNINNTGGNITALVSADCTASNASFILQASDGLSTSTATLNVAARANNAPTLSYTNPPAVALNGSLSINPADGPSDSGDISTIGVQSVGTFTGTISVDKTTGVVSISNAAPLGRHTITIRATANCGFQTDATFTLNVQTLGDYPDTAVPLGGNTTITPIPAAVNTSGLNVATSANFKGSLTADAATGVVRVTNASPTGTYTVKVTALDSTEPSKTFQLTVQQGTACAAPTFTSAAGAGVYSSPHSVAIGDFNNDGKQDFVTANVNANNVSIRLGDGMGGFTSPATPEVGVGVLPWSIAVGDFNNDGKLDFAIANLSWSNVSIRLGDGTGGFTSPATPEVGVHGLPYSIAVGDFNNDGKLDFVTANDFSAGNVSIRLGDGMGGFTSPVTPEIAVGSQPFSVTVGDFNNDGKADIAVANKGSNSVSIRLGDGAGGFTSPAMPEVGVGSGPVSVAPGDFDHDGKQDFATANSDAGTVSIRFGDGGGNFTGSTEVNVGAGLSSVAVGDFNNDGQQDFAVANDNSGNLSIRLGDGAGNFTSSPDINVGGDLSSVAVGDFNNDGKQDIAATKFSALSAKVDILVGGCNSPPAITAASGLSRVQDSPAAISQIATVTDDDGEKGNVTVTVTSANPSNGVTISNIVNTGGNITADIAADCTASNASFTLQASDGISTSTATLHIDTTANEAPVINVNSLSSTQGASAFNSQIATVSGNGGVIVTVISANPSNGVTISNVVNTGGKITADIVADCTASNASFTLQAAECAATSTADLNIAVTANDAPTLSYKDPPAVALNGSLSINPVTGPSDSGSVPNVSVQSVGTYTGTISVDKTTGIVSVSNAAPSGRHTITIRATDNCGVKTDATFTLSVQAPPTLGNYPDTTVKLGGNTTITPTAAPGNATGISVSTSANFKGTLTVDSATGIVRATNASLAGTYPVTVRAFNSLGEAISKTFPLTVQTGTACGDVTTFTNAPDVSVGSQSWAVAIGDFNNDGNQDLAVVNGGAATVSIRLGDGLAGFGATTDITAGSQFGSIAVGDFNSDGKQDLAITNFDSKSVSIVLGDGLGNFAGATPVLVGFNPSSVVVGDFNGDGKQDLAVANLGSNTVSIRLGDGAGNFSSAHDVPVTGPQAIVIGDFNNDGKQDLAVVSSSSVSIRLGDGLGGFSGTTDISVAGPMSIAVGDFNNDGKQDLAVVNGGSNAVSIHLGEGDGNFLRAPDVAVDLPRTVAIGDFNNDGKQDLAVAKAFFGTVSIRLGDGLGGFSGTTEVNVASRGSDLRGVAIGDFNNDGHQDLVAANLNSSIVSIRLAACNRPPTITAATGLSRVQGSPASNSQIATVTDDGGDNTVNVTVNSANPSNGVTITNIVNINGAITADIVADCSATNTSFTLTASDGSATATATLNITVAAKTAPTLSYTNPPVLAFNGSTTVNPITAAGITSIVYKVVDVAPALTFVPFVNSSGVVFISNARPAGPHTITIRATDNCNVTADASFTLTVSKLDQAITIGTHAPSSAVSGSRFPVAAGANSGLPITYSSAGACTNVGPTFTMTSGTGTCTVKYDQPGDSNYNPATQVVESVNAQKANQTITFASLPARTFGDAPFGVSATGGSSGNAVTFSSQTPSVCTASGNTVTILSVGNCTIRASQAGNSNYNPAPDVDRTFAVAKTNQTITFGILPSKTFGDADFTVSATASSNLPISFNPSGNCTMTGNSVHITGAGSCTISASQTGDSNYNVAPDVPLTFNIAKAPTTTVVTCPSSIAYTGSALTPCSGSVTGAAGLSQSLTINYTENTNAGTAHATASFAGDGNHANSSDSKSFTVDSASSTTTVTCPTNVTYTGAALTPCSAGVTGVGGLNQSLIVNYHDNTNAGTAQASASFSGDPNHTASSDSKNFTITADNSRKNQSITFGPLANKTFGDPDFTVSATASSALNVSFTAIGQCTLSGNMVHLTGVGSCTITAQQAGDSDYNAAPDVPRTFSVNPQDGPESFISFSAPNYNVNEGAGFVTITTSRSGNTAAPTTVDYATSDTGAPANCGTLNSGFASSRCDFTAAFGTFTFAANETQKTLNILINQDSFTEGPETFTINLSNPTGGAALATPSSSTITISDSAPPAANTSDDTAAFVRQQYHDFLNREPDPVGLAFWIDNIDKCNDPARRPAGQTVTQCIEIQRINTAGAFFLSIEFLQTGCLVRDFYVAALDRPLTNNMPGFVEFMRDTQAVQRGVVVGQPGWEAALNANRLAFMNDFVMRTEFVALYPTTDTPTQYVNKLYQHAGVPPDNPGERDAAIAEFGSAAMATDPSERARALLRVTQNPVFHQRELTRAFVQMQYLGYVRRDPNAPPDMNFNGYNFWLNKLNAVNGNYIEAEMVKAFITSAEYRGRFGP